MHARTLILGHRGSPRELPENTMASFRRALEVGADGIELDVQPSADGVPVILHDDALDRTTDATGDVSRLAWARIAEARAGGEPVPRLEEVAAWGAETGAFLNVEIKRGGVERAAIDAIAAAGLLPSTVFSSFLPDVVAAVRKLAPDAQCYLLTETWGAEVLSLARQLGVHGICLGVRAATASALQELRAANLPVIVWTVDEPDRIRELIREDVRAIITNLPSLAVSLVRS